MKKIIIALLLFFLGINCFAYSADDLKGKWELVSSEDEYTNLALTFSKDSLIIDDKCEGFGYTFVMNNDIIEVYNSKNSPFGYSEADFYIKLLSDTGDDSLTIAFIDRETGEGIDEPLTYVKIKQLGEYE